MANISDEDNWLFRDSLASGASSASMMGKLMAVGAWRQAYDEFDKCWPPQRFLNADYVGAAIVATFDGPAYAPLQRTTLHYTVSLAAMSVHHRIMGLFDAWADAGGPACKLVVPPPPNMPANAEPVQNLLDECYVALERIEGYL